MIGRHTWAIGQSLRRIFAPGASSRAAASRNKEVISGSAGNVIIVKSPNTEYFKEAIFILCDDLFTREGVSRSQLLREARRAACAYTASHTPPRRVSPWLAPLCFLLGAAACYLVMRYLI